MRVIVAGFGNVLRGDDGFGVAVADALAEAPLPHGVDVVDVGIGGIHLVQMLLDEVDGMVMLDALDLRRPPGTVVVTHPDVRRLAQLPPERRRVELADMHFATPERALMLADALGVLPRRTVLVGCQVSEAERFGEGLSAPVAGAVRTAATEVRRVVTEFGISWC